MTEVTKDWIDLDELAGILRCNKETLRRKCVSGEIVSRYEKEGKYKKYQINLNSLSVKDREKYESQAFKRDEKIKNACQNSLYYKNAPEWAKNQADKYLEIINLTQNMKRNDLKNFVEQWNKSNPDKPTSLSCIYKARIIYENLGVEGLLSSRGRYSSKIKVNKDYYNYYKDLYLNHSKPSVRSCWQATLEFAKEKDNITLSEFPSARTFDRLLKSRVSKKEINSARYGNNSWDEMLMQFLPKDCTKINAGSCWVCDHAQINIAVNFKRKVRFPWVTVFRDVKTSKWLGWYLYVENPTYEHIFQAFQNGAKKFGLPDDIYLEKDIEYKYTDFIKGKTSTIKVEHESVRETAQMMNIGVKVHYVYPYNARIRPVESDFSEYFTKYYGNPITQRPKNIKAEIDAGNIMTIEDFKKLFDDYIENYLNKRTLRNKVLQHKSPDELWEQEFIVPRFINKDILKAFCMKTERAVKIGRNGVYDSQLDVTYWDEWMIFEKGRKVFIRRDIEDNEEALIYDDKTWKLLGKGTILQPIPFLARTPEEREILRNALERKNREQKIIKSFIKSKFNPSNEDIVENLINSLDKTEFESNPTIMEFTNPLVEQFIEIQRMEREKTEIINTKNKKVLYLTESQKRRAESKEQQ